MHRFGENDIDKVNMDTRKEITLIESICADQRELNMKQFTDMKKAKEVELEQRDLCNKLVVKIDALNVERQHNEEQIDGANTLIARTDETILTS